MKLLFALMLLALSCKQKSEDIISNNTITGNGYYSYESLSDSDIADRILIDSSTLLIRSRSPDAKFLYQWKTIYLNKNYLPKSIWGIDGDTAPGGVTTFDSSYLGALFNLVIIDNSQWHVLDSSDEIRNYWFKYHEKFDSIRTIWPYENFIIIDTITSGHYLRKLILNKMKP